MHLLSGMRGLPVLELLRVKHWLKNVLVFFPLLFSRQMLSPELVENAIWAFLAFCFISSSVYIFNDLKDLEKDRLHPEKCHRPIASGVISSNTAIAIMLFLVGLSVTANAIASSGAILPWLLLLGYFLLNLFYSCGLKRIALVDLAILSTGFIVRVYYGGAVCCIEVSPWLFLTVLSLSVYFALGKRRGELDRTGGGDKGRLAAILEGISG